MKRMEIYEERNQAEGKYQRMMKYIPGSVHQCLADEWFTIIEMSESFLSLFGYTEEEIWDLFHNRYLDMVFSEDRKQLQETVKRQMEEGDSIDVQYRIQTKDGSVLWILDKARVVRNEDGTVSIYCLLLDISQQNKEREYLHRSLEKAYLDSLTGLLNKGTAEKRILDALNHRDQGFLLLIDLDDFKVINDQYGHLCGDAVLTDLSEELKKMFRKDDILARVGGDEFLAFLADIPKDEVEKRMENLLERLSGMEINNRKGMVSCSIGAACYPEDAMEFHTLYHMADQALYHRKSAGKGSYTFYTPETGQEQFIRGISRTAVNAVIESDRESVDKLLAQYSFSMLFNAIETQTAVDGILEIVGRAYDVSRVYIFEDVEDGNVCNNTFEWCNTGIEPEINNLQGIRYGDDIGDYRKNFDENGVFYCKDIRKLEPKLYEMLNLQGIFALLQCAIFDDGKFIGYVGFDECKKNRYWTREQIDSLTLISKVLGTFLLKHRLKEKVRELEKKLKQ